MVDGIRVGVEVKVTDVLDALFDVVKLVTAVFHGRLDAGVCVVAATGNGWGRGGTARCSAPRA